MIRFCFFLAFCVLAVINAFGQNEMATLPSASVDKVTSIDPTVFIVNAFTYKRVEEKKDNNTLRLGIHTDKIFVIDSTGNIQPYIIDNFDCSVSLKGGGIEIFSCVGNSIADEIHTVMAKSDIGSKVYFDGVVVRDSDRKSHKDIVRPLVIQRVK
ncbi:MAG: hypothetical protein HYU69_03595 [Bacteroidetes bacterium]|nr:hypothetical protein [Bacteroidota bacterium]